MHSDDRFGVRGKLALHISGIYVQGFIDISHDGNCPHLEDRFPGCQKSKGRHKHFIARPDIQGGQGNLECGGTGRDPQGISRAAVTGKFLFKLPYLENALPFVVKTIAHQDARFHDIHDFLEFFRTHQFKTGHVL